MFDSFSVSAGTRSDSGGVDLQRAADSQTAQLHTENTRHPTRLTNCRITSIHNEPTNICSNDRDHHLLQSKSPELSHDALQPSLTVVMGS